MKLINSLSSRIDALKSDAKFDNMKKGSVQKSKRFLLKLFKAVILIGISYVILAPIIGIISRSFFSDADNYNPMVYLIPINPTFQKYKLVIERMNYFPTMGKSMLYSVSLMIIQIIICSMVGYGFSRFKFPFKKLLFGCVVIMIVIPVHTIMLPLYMSFAKFDPLGVMTLFTGSPKNLLSTPWPMYIMTFLGCGLRSGIYIYLFNQFFRGLPKEIEEAALVDGAGIFYTFFRIMLPNATPSIITVSIFSLVWQYNDTFYAKLFLISPDILIGKKISTLQATIAYSDKIMDTNLQQLYLYAGIVLVILPVLIIYMVLQKYFIEGVERSGIVG